MTDVLKTELTVPYGPKGKEDTFVFKIPTLHDEIKIGARMEKLHRTIDPEWNGFSQGLDGGTLYALRAAATLELLLIKASVTWPFNEDAAKVVGVDSGKFPVDKAAEALGVYAAFDDALAKFRSGGAPDNGSTGEKALDGQPGS